MDDRGGSGGGGGGGGGSGEERGMKLVDGVVRKFRVAKVFRENTDRINSMDFSPSGDLLISSAEDDQIVIYDCEKGTQKRTLNSKKYGVDLIHFTHAKNTAIHSSTKIDDTIRYLSLHDNKYLRYFPGHTKKVTTLCMSPTDDTFLSGSLDRTLRLWDLRSPNCQGLMHLLGKPVAAFDPEGLIFAAGVNNESVKLYDLRSFDKGPFSTFKFAYEKENEWASLKFSPDGKTIMICSYGSMIRLVDAFHGTPLRSFAGFVNTKNLHIEASFSPDSQFVFSGSSDSLIHVWNAEHGHKCVWCQVTVKDGTPSLATSPSLLEYVRINVDFHKGPPTGLFVQPTDKLCIACTTLFKNRMNKRKIRVEQSKYSECQPLVVMSNSSNAPGQASAAAASQAEPSTSSIWGDLPPLNVTIVPPPRPPPQLFQNMAPQQQQQQVILSPVPFYTIQTFPVGQWPPKVVGPYGFPLVPNQKNQNGQGMRAERGTPRTSSMRPI